MVNNSLKTIAIRGAVANYSFQDIIRVGREWELDQSLSQKAREAEKLGGVFQCIMIKHLADCYDESLKDRAGYLIRYWRENIRSV
jgi:hypothetical protein